MSESLDRRHFLGAAAATGVALHLSAKSYGAAQGANDKLVIGVIGTGGRGTGLATAFQRLPGVEVAHVCDADRGRAEAAANAVRKVSGRAPQVQTDLRRVFDDRGVNAVVIAACNHWHAPATILACAAGKHVYVEKPCSHNAREGELMVQAARKHRRQVQLGTQRRSWPRIIEAIEEVRKGTIGRAYFAQAWYQNDRPSIGHGKEAPVPKGLDYELWQGPAPRRPFRSNYLHYNWHWFWNWGNGELGNNGIHMLDVCRWGLGVDYPVHVTSSGGRYRFRDDQETPDTHIASFDFPERKTISWEGLSCSRLPAGGPGDVLFHGENGTLAIRGGGYVVFDRAGKELRRVAGSDGDEVHLRNFLDAVRAGNRLNAEIEEGHKSTLLCHLGNIAHRTGHALRCDPKNGHILQDKEAMGLWSREYAKGWEPRV